MAQNPAGRVSRRPLRPVTRTIPLAEPNLRGNEAAYLLECIEENYVSSVGPFVGRFETAFAETVGSKFAVACASGTAALHVALLVAGAGPDAPVAVSTFTFIASVNAVRYTGAPALLIDSEPVTWNLDGEQLLAEMDRRADAGLPLPRVVEVVHVLGHPADIEPLQEASRRYGVVLVEDAAESLGAQYTSGELAGRQVGTVGAIGCFSFNGNKLITTGGGGMIVTDDEVMADRARHLSTQARLPGLGYSHDQVGFNYRMTNLAAAVGLAQLERLKELLEAKCRIAGSYRKAFSELGLEMSPSVDWARSSDWLFSILMDDGPAAAEALSRSGVGARPLWTPAHLQPPYSHEERVGGAVAESLHRRGLSLPSGTALTDAELETVIGEVRALAG